MRERHIHFIGIGGIGIRASGSDAKRSELTDALRREGVRVAIGPHRRVNIPLRATEVIRTNAIRDNNREVREARKRGLVVRSYAEALGDAAREFRSIAIAGAHGKSTTTALVALVLIRGGLNPTVVVGTKLREFGDSNFRPGRSAKSARGGLRYFVYEADEYRASFLNYSPDIAVVTNIDREHLDYYKNIRRIEAAFLHFLFRLRRNGTAILNRDDARLRAIAKRLAKKRPDCRIVWFSLRDPAAERVCRVLKIPGKHNLANAFAAYRVGATLHIPRSAVLAALGIYRGAWRRFDYQGTRSGAKIFADYAHHPTEIKATLQGARERFPKRRIVAVFQPHRYERLKDLFKEFAAAFNGADLVLLLDVYEVAGREEKRKSPNISSAALAQAIARRGREAYYLGTTVTRANLKPHLRSGDVLLLMGAGSIWEMTKRFMARQ